MVNLRVTRYGLWVSGYGGECFALRVAGFGVRVAGSEVWIVDHVLVMSD